MLVANSDAMAEAIVVPVVVAALSAAATLVLAMLGQAADRRRDHYADAVQALVAWVEFPYRIRRRTSDDPATLTALASLGADLQERMAWHETWIASDHPKLAAAFAGARSTITAHVRPAAVEAWSTAPVTSPGAMNLGDWGPATACQQPLIELQRQITRRFGFRRVRDWFDPT
jgi:hypothetical protein